MVAKDVLQRTQNLLPGIYYCLLLQYQDLLPAFQLWTPLVILHLFNFSLGSQPVAGVLTNLGFYQDHGIRSNFLY